MEMHFRCVAIGHRNRWEAMCVDLDIAVQGGSFSEVKVSLETAMEMYFERVAELPDEEQVRFLSRRAPWYVHLKFALVGLFRRLCNRDNHQRLDFMVHGGNATAHA